MLKLGIDINTTNIIIKAIELFSDFKNKNYHSLLNWCYMFLKRNNYSIRQSTHVGQLKNNSKFEFIKFLIIFYSIIRNYQINLSYEYIINMDETPIWLEMIGKKKLEKIGNKTVILKLSGQKEIEYLYYWL